MTNLRTALYDAHVELGAKMVPFGGWEMPVQYTSIKDEHHAVRNHVGLFDVSHMGEAFVEGKGALETLQTVMTNDVSKLIPGKAQYSLMCTEQGGTVDDLLVYCFDNERYLVIPNAANRTKDIEWIKAHQKPNTTITDVSDDYALLALQGPKSEEVLQSLVSEPLNELGFFQFLAKSKLLGTTAIISRSGYTGEDGFEIYCKSEDAKSIWNALLEKEVTPCGLGARDTLRLEARLPLYGQELSDSISPLEAKLGFAVKTKKSQPFIGQKALQEEKEQGVKRQLVGIEMIGKGIPRTDYPLYNEREEVIGHVTSGTQSPTLGTNVGLALLDEAYTAIDTTVRVGIRKRIVEAKVIQTPFYKR
ncbi:glycine cleavage system protein T [Bacillaceae bacterium JMAK1]|nr:glycine cleavage system protein T [Bacillaceae bacterium JMAK1]